MKLLPVNFNEKVIYALSMGLSNWINGNMNLSKPDFTRILVFKLDEIGDLCYALHVFDLLHHRYPAAQITLCCKPFSVSLVESNPNIYKVVTSVGELDGVYDLIVDLRGNLDTLRYAISHKPLARVDRGTVRYRNKKKGGHPHEVYTNLQIIEPLLHEVPETPQPQLVLPAPVIDKVNEFKAKNRLHQYAVMHAGARRMLRRWPPSGFAAIATWLRETYDFEIVFAGDTHDEELVNFIQSKIPFTTFNICGTFSLLEFAALVSQANLYIGNESGPLCIASVSGAPSLGLFGPGEPVVFYPYGKRTAYLHHVLECNPCDQVHCVHPTHPCIERISIEQVKQRVIGLLTR